MIVVNLDVGGGGKKQLTTVGPRCVVAGRREGKARGADVNE